MSDSTTTEREGGAAASPFVARLLFLSASARPTGQLAVDREYNRVRTRLEQIGAWRDWHEHVEHIPAATWDQMAEQLLVHKASIVHFAGHGYPDGSLEFTTPDGTPERISVQGLAKLFEAYAGQVRLVVLNACYSDALAEALNRHVDVVIGMPHTIKDDDAAAFSPPFYQQLAGGKSVQVAYEVARALLIGRSTDAASSANRDAATASATDKPELAEWLPRLRPRAGVDASQMRFVARDPAAGSDAPAQRRPAVQPAVPLLLAALLVLFVIGAGVWGQVFRSQVGVWNVLVLGVFSLLAAAVLSGVLGATGVVKTASQQIGGAAAIFAAVFSAVVAGALQLEPRSPVLRLLVTGLNEGERAQVSLVGGCGDTAVGPVGAVQLPLAASCDSDPLHVTVVVAGNELLAINVARSDAVAGKLVEIPIVRRTTEPVITGTVYAADSKLLREGRVILAGCATAHPADIDANNGGFVLHVPADCKDLHPPYTLIIRHATGEAQITDASQTGNRLRLPGTPPNAGSGTPVPLPRPPCHIDRDYWQVRRCKKVISSSAPDADELRRLRAEFPQCGEFILDKCVAE